jgi:hypothetical protein
MLSLGGGSVCSNTPWSSASSGEEENLECSGPRTTWVGLKCSGLGTTWVGPARSTHVGVAARVSVFDG